MNRTTIAIKGMHCRSCELLVEDELLKVPGVAKVRVSHRTGTAEIQYATTLSRRSVARAVRTAGYSLGVDRPAWLSRNPEDYLHLGLAVVATAGLWWLVTALGLLDRSLTPSAGLTSLPVVLLVGLTAGVSTCMALVGGLVLGISARFAAQHPDLTPAERIKPHLFFNLGRIASFFLLGGLVGLAGSVLEISPTATGALIILAALVMLVLGVQITGVSPVLSRFSLSLPAGLSRRLGIVDSQDSEYSPGMALILGGLTFFLPCGLTQAMQIYAMSTGSFLAGALTMAVFAIGTAPGLLGIGGLAAAMRGALTGPFLKFAGVVVVGLALFNLSNGLNLTGWGPVPSAGTTSAHLVTAGVAATAPRPTATVGAVGGVDQAPADAQVIRMDQVSSGYRPNLFTVHRGVPVRWVIDSKASNSCATSLVVPKLGIRKLLKPGENVIEFTPTEVGQIKFSCSMGMYTGVFDVVG